MCVHVDSISVTDTTVADEDKVGAVGEDSTDINTEKTRHRKSKNTETNVHVEEEVNVTTNKDKENLSTGTVKVMVAETETVPASYDSSSVVSPLKEKENLNSNTSTSSQSTVAVSSSISITSLESKDSAVCPADAVAKTTTGDDDHHIKAHGSVASLTESSVSDTSLEAKVQPVDMDGKTDAVIQSPDATGKTVGDCDHRMRARDKFRLCESCGSTIKRIHVCSRCRKVAYCNRKCQQSHWKRHKKNCAVTKKKVAEEEEEDCTG